MTAQVANLAAVQNQAVDSINAGRVSTGRSSVRTIALAGAIAALVATSACEKTGEGEYQVEKPVIGTETDTVQTPSVETGTVTDTINVPDVDVNTEKKEVKLPKVDVETPSERAEEGN
jgi:hypothetical protein